MPLFSALANPGPKSRDYKEGQVQSKKRKLLA